MTPVRSRHAIAAALIALCAAGAAAFAQNTANRLCRVHWQEETYGGDTMATTAVFEITSVAPQADGSVFYMGQGDANIVFTPGGGCTAAAGANPLINMTAIVSSDDGRTATVDIGPMTGEYAFPVSVRCPYPHASSMDVTASTPPSVTLPLRDGATADYDDSSTHSGHVGGQRGAVRLEFCGG